MSLRCLGALDPEQAITNNEVSNGLDALDLMLAQWSNGPDPADPGLKMWLYKTSELSLSSKASYVLKSSGGDLDIEIPEDIISVIRRDTDDNDTPLSQMTHDEYWAIGDKTATGTPERYYYERGKEEGTLYLDNVPSDTTDVLEISYRRRITTPTSDAVIDVEETWLRALKWALAIEIAPEYNATITPGIIANAQESRIKANHKSPDQLNELDYFRSAE